jgi:hypothetical protein
MTEPGPAVPGGPDLEPAATEPGLVPGLVPVPETVLPPHRAPSVPDRAIAVLVTGTLALFAVLVALVVYLVLQVSDVADANQAAAVSSCQQSNVNRAEDIAIWNRLLGAHPATPAAAAEITDLKRLVKIKDTPHDCH